jgi:hypothetical protein
VEGLLKILNDFDCVDLMKFHGSLSRFPNVASTSAIRANEDVQALKIKFVKEFWIATGKEFVKKITRDKLEEVTTLNFVEVLLSYEHFSLDFYQFLFIFF